MSEQKFETTKAAVLKHISGLFEEMETEMTMSHQEKYALLEDAFEQATDGDELRVAFDQWFTDHEEELNLDHQAEELWNHAINRIEDDDYDW